jgi:hypothetical protein
MAEERIPDAAPPKTSLTGPGMDEVSKCLLRALLVAEWPELAVKPQLTLIQGGKGSAS